MDNGCGYQWKWKWKWKWLLDERGGEFGGGRVEFNLVLVF